MIWEVNFTAGRSDATVRLDFELAGMMNRHPTVGTWVYPTINTAASFNFTALPDSTSGPFRAQSASRSLRRLLLMPQVKTGSLYRCGKGD